MPAYIDREGIKEPNSIEEKKKKTTTLTKVTTRPPAK